MTTPKNSPAGKSPLLSKKNALLRLIKKVEEGTLQSSDFWPSRSAPPSFAGRFSPGWRCYLGRLDAAEMLHNRIAPECSVDLLGPCVDGYFHATVGDQSEVSTSKVSRARAWLLALLRHELHKC